MGGAIAAVVAGAYAIIGGEYGTWDWLRLRGSLEEERRTIERLTAEVDSLERALRLLQTDPATRERVAREQYGMIKDGELLYRLVPAQ